MNPPLSQLPFLLRLIDDPSPRVREKVLQVLRSYGSALHEQAPALRPTLSPAQLAALDLLLSDDDSTFHTAWMRWIHRGRSARYNYYQRLEEALDILARWQMGSEHPLRLRQHLDHLASEFARSQRPVTAQEISEFLFVESGLSGASPSDYHSPLHSNLVWVVENGRGLPLSLSLIFMLVSYRLGVPVHGCNFPSHFMARASENGRDLLFDPFHKGRLLPDEETAAIRRAAPHEFNSPPGVEIVIGRVLMNLVHSYSHSGDDQARAFIRSLLNDMRAFYPHSLRA
jgi:hypothetical protein